MTFGIKGQKKGGFSFLKVQSPGQKPVEKGKQKSISEIVCKTENSSTMRCLPPLCGFLSSSQKKVQNYTGKKITEEKNERP